MAVVFWLPLAACLVGLSFAVAVASQFRARRRPYQAAWALALLLFALASQQEAVGILRGWDDLTYKGYYLFGGVLDVGWLAVGTVYLLAPRRIGTAAAALMGIASVAGAVAVMLSHTDPNLLRAATPGRGAITGPATLFAPLINIPGSVVLIGGAALSAYRGFRRRAPSGRVAGTTLIAAGAFIVAFGHSLAQVRGVYAIQPAAEAAGIVVMFAGYLSVEGQRRPLARSRDHATG
jgi:hypothetical protein